MAPNVGTSRLAAGGNANVRRVTNYASFGGPSRLALSPTSDFRSTAPSQVQPDEVSDRSHY